MADPKDIWRCQMVNCGYMYDPDRGDKRHKIPAGTKFEDLPDDWRCPVCGAKMESSVCPICGMEPADQHTIRPAHGALNRPLLKREMKKAAAEPIEGQTRLPGI